MPFNSQTGLSAFKARGGHASARYFAARGFPNLKRGRAVAKGKKQHTVTVAMNQAWLCACGLQGTSMGTVYSAHVEAGVPLRWGRRMWLLLLPGLDAGAMAENDA